jgi:CheY-like chemotaxis protein
MPFFEDKSVYLMILSSIYGCLRRKTRMDVNLIKDCNKDFKNLFFYKSTRNNDALSLKKLQLEHNVRLYKLLKMQCPNKHKGHCVNAEFRCGERETVNVYGKIEYKCRYEEDKNIALANVLVVDDEEVILEVCSQFLLKIGFKKENIYTASGVSRSKEILKKIRNMSLIISDIMMREDTGYSLVDYIISRNINSKVLLMTGTKGAAKFPDHYLGNMEMIFDKKPVACIMPKPFTLSEFRYNVLKTIQ